MHFELFLILIIAAWALAFLAITLFLSSFMFHVKNMPFLAYTIKRLFVVAAVMLAVAAMMVVADAVFDKDKPSMSYKAKIVPATKTATVVIEV